MTGWTPEQLDTIDANQDLSVSPFRDDGTTYGTPTQTWALVVDGKVHVRAANGPKSRCGSHRAADQIRGSILSPPLLARPSNGLIARIGTAQSRC